MFLLIKQPVGEKTRRNIQFDDKTNIADMAKPHWFLHFCCMWGLCTEQLRSRSWDFVVLQFIHQDRETIRRRQIHLHRRTMINEKILTLGKFVERRINNGELKLFDSMLCFTDGHSTDYDQGFWQFTGPTLMNNLTCLGSPRNIYHTPPHHATNSH